MNAPEVIDIAKDGIYLLIKISLPILLTALIIGFIISLIQALTQIQEPTISFVPKIIAIFLMILFTLNFIGSNIKSYSHELMSKIVHIE